MTRGEFYDNAAVIIPVYNEGKVIKGVVTTVLEHFKWVICVNDGSRDNSAAEIAKTKAILINHPLNMGQGAALQTGLEYASDLPGVEYFVHFDADGQHGIDDVLKMLKVLRRGQYDIVLGSRFLEKASTSQVPFKKRLLLRLAVVFTRLTTGLRLTDAHNGLRVFNRRAAEALEITLPDMAHASEILSIIRNKKLRYTEVPVTIHYNEYAVAKGQSMLNAVNIAYDILAKGKK